ncbi:hypothetical protein J3A83DRAFT_4248816, partial [Scleroderma citrinum]
MKFFRIFRFHRKQKAAKPGSPSCPNCHPKRVSKRLEPLSIAALQSELALGKPPASPSPILVTISQDPVAQAGASTGRVPSCSKFGQALASPVLPHKKRHVSFAVAPSKAEAGSPSPTPSPSACQFRSPSPSPSELSTRSTSSISTLVNTSGVDDTSTSFGTTGQLRPLSSTSICKKPKSKTHHMSMLPSTRSTLDRPFVPVSAIRTSMAPQNRNFANVSSPTLCRTSKRFSIASTASI